MRLVAVLDVARVALPLLRRHLHLSVVTAVWVGFKERRRYQERVVNRVEGM